jgi:hypothetical protein
MARGGSELSEVGRQLRAVGEATIRTTTQRELKAAERGLTDAATDGAQRLPSRGGLAAAVAATRITSETRVSGTSITTTIRGHSDIDLDRLDRGQLAHPLYGNRGYWFTQSVEPGWWTEEIRRRGERIVADIEKTVATAVEKALR